MVKGIKVAQSPPYWYIMGRKGAAIKLVMCHLKNDSAQNKLS